MHNPSISRLRAIVSSFYANLMRGPAKQKGMFARSPMTVIGDSHDEAAKKEMAHQEEGMAEIDAFFSVEEKGFIQRLKGEFQLLEDDLMIFNLVAYARHAGQGDLMNGAKYGPDRAMQPDFSPEFLSMLMECVRPSLTSSRGYYAAMVHLKHHPAPAAWKSDIAQG
ncbi:MAG: hypothetical protein Q8O37_15495 [Sulfuricellaceae bacterium]|nr:hypothetical protein [Sulfuricellaceae bacterium]